MAIDTCSGCGTIYIDIPTCHAHGCPIEEIRKLKLQIDGLRNGILAAANALQNESRSECHRQLMLLLGTIEAAKPFKRMCEEKYSIAPFPKCERLAGHVGCHENHSQRDAQYIW